MAGCEELAHVEEVPAMVEKERSERPGNGKEFVASWFLERCLAKDGQETSEALDGERKLFSGAATKTSIDKIQAEKMGKAKHAAVNASGSEKRRFSTIPKGAMGMILRAKVHEVAASEQPAAVKGKMRLPEEYVCLILAMPREKPLPLALGTKEEMACMTEERRQQHEEGEARSQMIYRDFIQFQNRVRDEFLEKGYVEVADDYLTNLAAAEKEDRELWEESKKKRDPILTSARRARRGDPDSAVLYAPFDPVKQARSLLSEVN